MQSPEAVQLAQLQVDLTQAIAVYSPTNPKVVLLQTRIRELQAKVGAGAPATGPTTPATPDGTAPEAKDPAAKGPDATTTGTAEATPAPTDGTPPDGSPMSLIDIQTTEIESQIARLTQESTDIAKQLATLKASIDRSSAIGVQLEALNRDYANIQAQYDTATDRLSKASTGERIAVLSKGQRIGVLDAATVPDVPTRPRRQRIIAAGAAAGLGLGLGLVALLELMNTSVRRPVDLERYLNITPIGTIPYTRTPGEMLRRRLTILLVILIIAAGLPAAVWLIDQYYMPVDLILAKISSKLGL